MIKNNSIIDSYSNIKVRKIKWLWYPYIPSGKITIVEGDPGDGKTSFVLFLVALLSKNERDVKGLVKESIKIIYQTAEDSPEDTIKPRLIANGANCDNIYYINKSFNILDNLNEIEKCIDEVHAKLLVLDPLQAFLGKANLNNVNDLRPNFEKLNALAEKKDCSIVLISHMNKSSSSKDLYRTLGSIDIVAIARSVLLISKCEYDDSLRTLEQIKNNLSRLGDEILFSITSDFAVKILDEKHDSLNKTHVARKLLSDLLISNESVTSAEAYEYMTNNGISRRLTEDVKRYLNIKSVKKGDCWYWVLPMEVTNNGQ